MHHLKRKFAPSTRSFSCCHICRDQRPPTAPKQVPDIRRIREDPNLYSRNAVLRNYKKHERSPERIAVLSDRISQINKQLNEPRKRLKALEQQLGILKARKDDEGAQEIYRDTASARKAVDKLVAAQEQMSDEARDLALALPNLTSKQTPTDDQPRLIKYINYDPNQPPVPLSGADHSSIGTSLAILDFASASTTSGWGFYYLLNEAVFLENALIQYAMSLALKRGWSLCTPPSLVYQYMADSCGFQPRDASDEQQIWQIAQPEKDTTKPIRALAATAEIPLAAMYADKQIPASNLPLKLIGASRCYRAEAGARGVDTKGLYRVHEFTKVEMFAWTLPDSSPEDPAEHSTKVFDEMLDIQIEFLSGLNLPLRVLEMPTSDLGASAHRKIDIEAFFPSRITRDQGWGELTSVSICTDYQTRRLGTRVKGPDGKVLSGWPHTVNGTACAVPRVLACILENGWDGAAVRIPAVLRPWMNGIDTIGPK